MWVLENEHLVPDHGWKVAAHRSALRRDDFLQRPPAGHLQGQRSLGLEQKPIKKNLVT